MTDLFTSCSDARMFRQARKRLKNATLREIIMALENQQPLTPGQMAYAQTRLTDTDLLFSRNLLRPVWDECWLTIWLLRHISMNTAEQERAATTLISIVEKRLPTPKYCLRRRVGNGLARTLLFLAAMFCYLLYHFDWLAGEGNWYSFIMLRMMLIVTCAVAPLFLPLFCLFDALYANRVRAAAVAALGYLKQASFLGVITKATKDSSLVVRNAALDALPLVLPSLTPEHYGSFSSETISGLCHILDHAEAVLQLTILEALIKVGDGNAVRSVERTAVKGRSEQARSLAIHVLPVLQQRQQQENASRMLLRASQSVSESSRILVRPAQESAGTEPHQLLRSSSSNPPSVD